MKPEDAIPDMPGDPAEGFFRAGCWLRKVAGEPVILLGGGRALLLEIAHPVVAAGVAEHSDFRLDPFGRLQRTLGAMSAIAFKDRASAMAAVRTIERTHQRVRGVFPSDVGRYRAGMPYSAADPEAMRWVWATLVDTAAAVYRCFVADLTAAAEEAYYAEYCGVARLLGVPGDLLPPTWKDFRAYFDGMIEGDALVVDGTSLAIAESLLDPPMGTTNTKLVRILTAALLPERLRAAFGLDWGAEKAARFESLVRSVRGLRRRSTGVAKVDARSDSG